MAAPHTDYDSPWKEALEHYLPDFLHMFLPDLHAQVDWSHPPIFLDKELQGGRITVAAFMQMGERMYRYFYRISDRLLQARISRGPTRVTQQLVNRGSKDTATDPADIAGEGDMDGTTEQNNATDAELFSLCVLTASAGGAPALSYQQGFGGYGVQFSSPVVHLAEWLESWDRLEMLVKTNPFAVVVMAQLMAQQTHGDGGRRFASKKRIVGLLYQYGYSRGDVLRLMRLVDWMMQLPAELEPLFTRAVEQIEQENKMAFVTSFERVGIQKGIQKGETNLLQRQLIRKFGTLPDMLQQRIQTATPTQLETWSLNILDATSLDDVFTE